MNKRFIQFAGVVAAAALTLSACGTNEQTTAPAAGDGSTTGASRQGTLVGIGASSHKVAMDTWIAKFQSANDKVTINYSPEGSGNGRTAFTNGGADFAGSDRAFKPEENAAGKFDAKCKAGTKALDLPLYISPIAVIYNLQGVSKLQLDAATAAAIFRGDIKNWNDPKIAALNAGVTLPNLAISTVHRSDNSGTTENFTDYLAKASGGVWTEKPHGDWPAAHAGEAAKGTSGVVAAVKAGNGTIGYADASQAKDVGIAEIGKDGKFYGPTADAAAQVVENSPFEEGRDEHDLALKLDRTADGYPIVLVAYTMVCQEYKDAKTGELVKAFVTMAASPEGQKAAAERAGSAPLSAKLTEKVKAAVGSIK